MMKFIFILFVLLVISVAIGNANTMYSEQAFVSGMETNCFTGDVLNCNGKSNGYHVTEEEVICPLGKEKFKAFYLGTHSTYGRHLDWEPVSYMRFPVPIPVCPTHGFVVTKKVYGKEELEKLKRVVESKSYQDIYTQKHATFYLFAKTKELNEEKFDDYWWLYLNATWEADNCANKVRYKEYALETISAAKKGLTGVKDSDELYWILNLITAEMYRRIGDFKTSQDLVDKIGTPSLGKKETNEYFILAKKLLQEAISEKNTDRVAISDVTEKGK